MVTQIIRRFFLTAVFFAVCFAADDGYAVEYRWGAEIFEGLFREDNFTDTSTATVDYDETYNIVGVYPDLYLGFSDHFKAFALAEVEWFYSWDTDNTADESDVDATLADIFVNFSAAGASFDAGLQPFDIGGGMVFYGDEPGISIQYDESRRFYLKGNGFRVFDHSSMATFVMGYRPGFLESVELIGAWYRDADDAIAELYQPFYGDTVVTGKGRLFYGGLQAAFFIGDFYVSGLAMQQFGTVELDDGAERLDFSVSAYLMDLEVSYNISGQLTMSGFFFAASGDNHPTSGNLHGFMSPKPFNPTTSIFFNGGFERYDVEEAVVLGGVTWDGVAAPGIRFEYQPNNRVSAELVTAALFPEDGLFDTGAWYGGETDIRVSYEFYQNRQLFFEAGYLYQGDYFEKTYGYQPDNATRLAGGLSFVF